VDGKLVSTLKSITAGKAGRLEALRQIADIIRSSGNYRWVGLYDVDHTTATVTNVVYSGNGAPEYPTFPITKGLTGSAIQKRVSINVGDVSTDSRYLTAFGTTQSEIIVPIFDAAGEKVVGTIDVESGERDAFDGDTQILLESCAKEISPLWKSRI
jgi:GAF domain-containing protein